MQKFCVATDSGCDLPAAFCEERGIYAYRMKYTIDGNDYFDQMNVNSAIEFYNNMRNGAVPVTSQMTPFEFIDLWTQLWSDLKLPIVHIAMGSGISVTYANAQIAKELFLESQPEAKVYIVDSTLASIGYGMLCIGQLKMCDAGKSSGECVSIWKTANICKYLLHTG